MKITLKTYKEIYNEIQKSLKTNIEISNEFTTEKTIQGKLHKIYKIQHIQQPEKEQQH